VKSRFVTKAIVSNYIKDGNGGGVKTSENAENENENEE